MRNQSPGEPSYGGMLTLQLLWSRRGQGVWLALVAGRRHDLLCNFP